MQKVPEAFSLRFFRDPAAFNDKISLVMNRSPDNVFRADPWDFEHGSPRKTIE